MIAAIARRLRRHDEGLTLIELVISTLLGLIILVVAGALLISTTRASAVQVSSDSNARGASTAMNSMSRYLHAATTYPTSTGTQPAFAAMAPTDVTFYAYVNLVSTAAQPVKVRFYVDSSTKKLIQQTYSSTCSVSTGYCTFSSTPKTINLGGPVASPTSDSPPLALFVYLNAGGAVTTDPSTVQSVQVNLEYGSATAGAPGNTHLTNKIALLNVGQFGGTN